MCMKRMLTCNLYLNEDGSVAELIAIKNNIIVARFGVRGPFKRTVENVRDGYDETFQGELCGIADYQYINEKGVTAPCKGVKYVG